MEQMDNNLSSDVVDGSVTTLVLMMVSGVLNMLHFVSSLDSAAHLVASCATVGAAFTTMYVGILTIKKLRREK